MAKEFDESKHPRAKDGKLASKEIEGRLRKNPRPNGLLLLKGKVKMKKLKWQEDYESLIVSITDEKDLDVRRSLIEEGFKSEERAKDLTQFIKENNIDCRGCFDGNHERYLDYEKLTFKEAETWEVVNEWGDD